MSKIRLLTFLSIFFLSPFLAGCGDSIVDDPISRLGPDTGQRVPHQSWNSYRLYSYQNGTWNTVVNLGVPVADQPALGDRPVVILHGLGSNIFSGRFSDLAENLLDGGATSVFGFEYDTLDSIDTNSTFFIQALNYLTQAEKDKTFRFVGHSMGALVARAAFESGTNFDMAATNNIASFPAGPHQGSEVAQELQTADSNLVDQVVAQLVLNGQIDFYNADGRLVDVTGDEVSFQQLTPNSNFLNTLNFEAATAHPQFVYRTVAGTTQGEFAALNQLLGVVTDDGLINIDSANAPVIGPASTQTVPFDHSTIVSAQPALLVILDQLELL